MHVKHGIQSSLRMPGKSLLTLLMFLLVMALLGTSVGVTASVSKTLRALSDSYTTIAVAEYVSEQEPDPAEIIRITDQISELSMPGSVRSWEPERLAQCWLGDLEEPINYRATNNYGLLVIETRTPGVFSSSGTISATVKQVLFSGKDVADKTIEVYWPGIRENTTCLVYGQWYRGTLGAAASLNLLRPPLELSSAADYEKAAGAQEFLELADQLRVRTNSVYAAAPEKLDHFFPFQQRSLQIREGRSFTPEEISSGAKVCLLSAKMAGQLKCKVGDRIPLSLAAGDQCPVMESYDPAKGFDLTDSFLVVGLLNAKENWENTIFLPPQRELDLSKSSGASALGQFILNNDEADDFLAWAEDHMPTGVRITIYDQGYAEAARPIRIMLRTVQLITAACVLAGVCFLLLNIWLFIARQKRIGTLMHRLGASGGSVGLYFLGAMLPVLLPGLAGGTWLSVAAGEKITNRIAGILKQSEQADLRFSDAQLSLRQSVELVQKNASKKLFLLIAVGMLAVCLALCLFFAVRTIPKGKKCRRFNSFRTHTRTRSLSGGSVKYALLASSRGGFRTLLSILAPLAAAILFCVLSITGNRTAAQLRDLETNATVRGYFTNIQGSSASGLLVKYQDAFAVGDMDLTVSMTATAGDNDNLAYWDYVGKLTNWEDLYGEHIEDIHVPRLPTGEFLDNILKGERRKNGIHLVATNSVNDVPGLMYSGNSTVTWADGYSDETMRGWKYLASYGTLMNSFIIRDDLHDSPEEELEKTKNALLEYAQPYFFTVGQPSVVSAAFLSEYGLSLGDSFFLAQLMFTGDEHNRSITVFLKRMDVIGVYSDSSDRNTIYYPISDCIEIGADGEKRREETFKRALVGTIDSVWPETMIINEMWDQHVKGYKMSSAVYRFRASELSDLKQRLEELGFTEVGFTNGARKPFILEDQTYLAAKRSVEQRLWYMKRTFPVVIVLAELLALLLGCLQTLSRRRELWLMHLTGTGRTRAFFSLLLEQLYLCPVGAALGLALCKYLGLLDKAGVIRAILFAGLWFMACLVTAAWMTLRPKKTGKE